MVGNVGWNLVGKIEETQLKDVIQLTVDGSHWPHSAISYRLHKVLRSGMHDAKHVVRDASKCLASDRANKQNICASQWNSSNLNTFVCLYEPVTMKSATYGAKCRSRPPCEAQIQKKGNLSCIVTVLQMFTSMAQCIVD